MAASFVERLQRASLGPRVLTATVGIPLVFLALWAGGLWWIALTAVVALIGWNEFVRLQGLGPVLRTFLLVLEIVLFAMMTLADNALIRVFLLFWMLVIIASGIFPYFWRRPAPTMLRTRPLDPNYEAGFSRLNALVLGPFYLAAPTALLARWRLELSAWSVLAFLLVIWASDTVAYFIGLAAGRHKLAPQISPGKSWEGAAAGTFAGMLVGVLVAPLFEIRPAYGVLFGVLTTIASQIGDLLESAMKRRAGVKDSGALLPGHGGILDRFDGLLVAAPVAYLFVRWFGR